MGSQATRPWLMWTVTALAALSLILVIVNAVIASTNRSSQATFYRQQQEILQGQQLYRNERIMTQRLADAAYARRDEDVRNLLSKYGVTFKDWPTAQNAPPPATPVPAKPAAPGGTK